MNGEIFFYLCIGFIAYILVNGVVFDETPSTTNSDCLHTSSGLNSTSK